MNLLSVQNITKKFGSTELFHNINFNINDNDRVAIVGNNGTGKSTLLKMILGQEDISNNGTTDLKGCISIAKNKQIVQFQKVAEKWYDEKLTIKMY